MSGIRVAVVGPAKSGRRSLVQAVTQVPPIGSGPFRADSVIFRTQYSEVQRDLLLHIASLEEVLQGGFDVVVLCLERYSCSSLEQAQEWIARLTQTQLPLLVALTKHDQAGKCVLEMRGGREEADIVDGLLQGLLSDRRLDAIVEVSAVNMENILDVFSFAVRSVVYPVAPLIDRLSQTLTLPYRRALKRIFRLIDRDCDEILSDAELSEFQTRCFGTPLPPAQTAQVKDMLEKRGEGQLATMADSSTGVTFMGFLSLHLKFFEKDIAPTCWIILEQFGYSRQLTLRDDAIPALSPIAPDQSCELSSIMTSFLVNLFLRFDADKDMALSAAEFAELFSVVDTVPFEQDYAKQVKTTETGHLTLVGWLSLWSMLAYVDAKRLVRSLTYLGYFDQFQKEQTPASLRVCRRKLHDHYQPFVDRNVVHGYVFGSPGCGKTTYLRRLVGQEFDALVVNEPTTRPYTVCSRATSSYLEGMSENLYIMLTEVPCHGDYETTIIEQELDKCDFVVLAYDCSDRYSLASVVSLLEEDIPDHLPVILVATKADCEAVTQLQHGSDQPINAEHITHRYNLPPPEKFYAENSDEGCAEHFGQFVEIARNPELFLPETDSRQHQRRVKLLKRWLKRGTTLSVLGLSLYYLVSRVRSRVSTPPSSPPSPSRVGAVSPPLPLSTPSPAPTPAPSALGPVAVSVS